MHILYLHQYFATPRGNTGTRSYEFARRWVAAGHRVTVVTSTAQLAAGDSCGVRGRFVKRLEIDGIHVIALNVSYRQTMGFVRRALAFVTFMSLAAWFVVLEPGVDVVYATSTPLTVGAPALAARWLRGRRFVFEVRDLWPLIPIEMGIIRSRFVGAALRCFERVVYRWADSVVALSPGMAEMVRQQSPPSKRIETVPNCADIEFFRPDVAGGPVRRERGWEGRVVFLHAGTMGRVNGLGIVVRAAEHFRDDETLLFVLLGEGKEKPALIAERDRLGLSELQILDGVPKSELPAILAAADVCLMTIANVPILEHNSANKLFDYLSAGRPVLLNYGGWQREVLESNGAGLGCSLGSEGEFFAKLKLLGEDESARKRMGRSARSLALARFDRDSLATRVLEVLTGAAPLR